jgi:hypothetical protein
MPPSLLFLAAHTPGLDWDSELVPETVSYQLYQHAHEVHRARFSPLLGDIRLWPADLAQHHRRLVAQGRALPPAKAYVRHIVKAINTQRFDDIDKVVWCTLQGVLL